MKYVYRGKSSPLLSLNEVTRIVLFLTLFFLSVLFSNIALQMVILMSILLTAISGRILRESLVFLKYLMIFISLLVIFSLFLAPGGLPIARVWFFSITLSPLLFSLSMGLRIVCSVLSLNLLLLAVNPDASIAFISRLGKKTAASLLVATRLMPVLANDGEDVIQAFESRGVSFRQGKWRERVSSASHLVFPMLYSTMDRALAVAEAMEVRGFPSRWKKKSYIYSTIDLLQLFLCAAAVLAGILMALAGQAVTDYYANGPVSASFVSILLFAALTFPLLPILGSHSYDRSEETEVQVSYE